MLSLDEFRKKLKEGDSDKNSGDTEWYLVSSSKDPILFDKIKNDILGAESVLNNLLQQPSKQNQLPISRDDINKEFNSVDGWSDEGGQWLDDDGEKAYLIAWNGDIINLYQRKNKDDIQKTGDEVMENTKDTEINSVEMPLTDGSHIDEEAVGSAAHFIFREYPEVDINQCVSTAMQGAQDTEGAISTLKTMIPTGYENNAEEDPSVYSNDDLSAFDDYRKTLRGKMFRDILHTEPPGVEDMEGQPGVYAQQRLNSHVDDNESGEVIPDGEPLAVPQNSDGVYADDLEEDAQLAVAAASDKEAKAAEERAKAEALLAKERADQAKEDAAQAQQMADQQSTQASQMGEGVINEADKEATTSQLGSALAGHGPEKIGQALANIQREDGEKYQQVLNSIPKEEQLIILDYISNVTGQDSTPSDENNSGSAEGGTEDIAGQLVNPI